MAGKSRPGNAFLYIWNVADGHALASKGYVPHFVPHTRPFRTGQPNLLATPLPPFDLQSLALRIPKLYLKKCRAGAESAAHSPAQVT